MISRRALFGLSAGAAVTAVLPVSAPAKPVDASEFIDLMSRSFVPEMMYEFKFSDRGVYYIPDSSFRNMEWVSLREIDVDLRIEDDE